MAAFCSQQQAFLSSSLQQQAVFCMAFMHRKATVGKAGSHCFAGFQQRTELPTVITAIMSCALHVMPSHPLQEQAALPFSPRKKCLPPMRGTFEESFSKSACAVCPSLTHLHLSTSTPEYRAQASH